MRSLLRPLAAAVLALLLPAAASAQAQPAAASVPARQLVLPFENTTGEGRLYWLSEGAAVMLTDTLQALGVQVISRDDRLRASERLHVPPIAALSHATVIRLGQLVGAAQVIVGSFELADDRLTVRARPIRLDTGRMLPEVEERGPLADMFETLARVAQRLAPPGALPAERTDRAHPPITAFEQFVKGLLAETPATQLTYLSQALKIHPTFQRVRLAMWQVHTEQGKHAEALAVVAQVPPEHALARRARFLRALSQIHLAQYQEAFDTLTELQRARPDPSLLNNIGVVQMRRPAGGAQARAVYYFNEAAKLEPNDSDLFFNLGYAYWTDRDVQAAIYWLREAVRRNPADHEAHYVLGVALQAAGQTAEAGREKELARQLSSAHAEWEGKQAGANVAPKGLERLKTEIDVPAALRVENVLVQTEQRDQKELARFHLERGRRLFDGERYSEALNELRRAVYLAPYAADAHLLLGKTYMQLGRTREAIHALKICLWSDPANTEASALLKKLQP